MASSSPQQPKPGSIAARPARTFVTGRVTKWLRLAAWVVVLATTAALAIAWAWLPDVVATHFNLAGQSDAWGPKSSMFTMAAIFIVMTLGLTWLSRHPRVFNYPAPVTEQNAQGFYRAGEQMIVWTALMCAFVYAGIGLSTLFGFHAALVLVPAMAGMFLSIIVGLARMMQVS